MTTRDTLSRQVRATGTAATPSDFGRLGRYELVARLATGGMGEIFLARLSGAAGFEKLIVVKRLLPELVSSEQFVAMFLDEARIAARLSHPNVCEVYELGQVDHQYFISMQYMEGVPFSHLIEQDAPDDHRTHVRMVAGLIQQACEGLHHAHELTDPEGRPLHVVHRDVSPSNLFVTVDGVLKVLDFGIAKARGATSKTDKGFVKGKQSYMSPEQVRGDELDRRSDIFSLGIVLFEAVTGRRLFKRGSDYLAARAILEEPIPVAHEVDDRVPRQLSAAIGRALERDADRRFATARDFGTAIGEALEGYGAPLTTTAIAREIRRGFADELSAQRASYARASAMAERSRSAAADDRTTNVVEPPTVPARPDALPHPPPARRSRAPIAALALVAFAAAAITWALTRRWTDAEPDSVAVAEPAPAAAPEPEPEPVTRTPPPEPATRTPPPEPDPDPRPTSTSTSTSTSASTNDEPRTTSANHALRSKRDPAVPAKPGYLSIDSTPYATIYIDGKRAGVTPLIRHRLPPGRHRIRAVTESGRRKRFTVEIESGVEAPARQLSW